MDSLAIIISLIFLGYMFLFAGSRLLSQNTLNLYVFNTQSFTSLSLQNSLSSKLAGLLTGLFSFESGIFGFMHNKISFNHSVDITRVKSMINWNIVGQYLFVVILFFPLPIYLLFCAGYFLLMWRIDKNIYPHAISIMLALLIIKFSVIALSFGVGFIKQYDEAVVFPSIINLFNSTSAIPFVFGCIIGFLTFSLAPSLILTAILVIGTGTDFVHALLWLSGIHLGLSVNYFLATQKLVQTAHDFTNIYFVSNFLIAILFLIFAWVGRSFPVLNALTSSTGVYTTGTFLLALAAVIIGSLIYRIPFIQNYLKKHKKKITGNKYFIKYAFTNCFSGVILFGRELSQIMSPIIKYSLTAKGGDEEIIHKLYKERFRELKSYIQRMLKIKDLTLASKQVLILSSILDNMINLESNFYEKSLLLKNSNLSERFKVKMKDMTNESIQVDDTLMTTYISILQNPHGQYNASLVEITKNICDKLTNIHDTSYLWVGENLKDIPDYEEEAILEYLMISESDIDIIQNLTSLWQKLIQFIPESGYSLAHLEHQ